MNENDYETSERNDDDETKNENSVEVRVCEDDHGKKLVRAYDRQETVIVKYHHAAAEDGTVNVRDLELVA